MSRLLTKEQIEDRIVTHTRNIEAYARKLEYSKQKLTYYEKSLKELDSELSRFKYRVGDAVHHAEHGTVLVKELYIHPSRKLMYRVMTLNAIVFTELETDLLPITNATKILYNETGKVNEQKGHNIPI